LKIKSADDKWLLYTNDEEHSLHNEQAAPRKRGINSFLTNDVNDALLAGKKPKLILSIMRTKYNDSHQSTLLPSLSQLNNRRNTLKRNKNNLLGMNFLSDISDFIERFTVTTKSEFEAKGNRSKCV
jgi:hypothetical protein